MKIILALAGITGFIYAMNDDISHVNFIGLVVFAAVCFLGSTYKKRGKL